MSGEEKKRNPATEASSSQPPAKKKRLEQIRAGESNSNKKEQGIELEKNHISRVGVTIPDSSHEEPQIDQPQKTPRYALKFYQYLQSLEEEPKRRPLSNYMESVQRNVTADMRAVLIDWLIDVAEVYGLQSDTLFLTVSYIDRYFSHYSISRQRLQLLGLASMLIAWKYQEITPPHVEYSEITTNGYRKEEVLDMESDLLEFLNGKMGPPTIMTFLGRFIEAAQEDSKRSYLKMRFVAHYLAELSLIDHSFVKYFPSVIAASAIYLARFTAVPSMLTWNKNLEESTGYKANDLKECVFALHKLQLSNSSLSLRVVTNKYQDKQLMNKLERSRAEVNSKKNCFELVEQIGEKQSTGQSKEELLT